MKIGQRIEIKWDDSNVGHGWVSNQEARFAHIAHCRHVGLFEAEDDEKITIAFGDSDCESIMEMLTIPKSCITSIKVLRVK